MKPLRNPFLIYIFKGIHYVHVFRNEKPFSFPLIL